MSLESDLLFGGASFDLGILDQWRNPFNKYPSRKKINQLQVFNQIISIQHI